MRESQFVSVRRRFTKGGTEVAVEGELDGEVAPRLRRVLAAAIVAGERISIDLGRVTFVDSSGLRAIVDARRAAAEFDVELVVVAAAPEVSRLLHLVGLDDLLEPMSSTA